MSHLFHQDEDPSLNTPAVITGKRILELGLVFLVIPHVISQNIHAINWFNWKSQL
jgi:hypothetical protein